MKITKLYSKIFSTRALSLAKLSWQEALESFRVMKSRFNVLILSLTDGLTKEWCIATHLFWKSCRSKGVRSGWLFLALYLKQSRVCLQRFCAGELPPATLSPAVSLTRGGIPRIIPSFHRRKIRGGDASIICFDSVPTKLREPLSCRVGYVTSRRESSAAVCPAYKLYPPLPGARVYADMESGAEWTHSQVISPESDSSW